MLLMQDRVRRLRAEAQRVRALAQEADPDIALQYEALAAEIEEVADALAKAFTSAAEPEAPALDPTMHARLLRTSREWMRLAQAKKRNGS